MLFIKKKSLLLHLLFVLILVSCAKRGTITGGTKDVSPPKIVNCLPTNQTTNFNGNSVKITFDEYVKIKNLDKNLIVSPMLTHAVTVTPQAGVSKHVVVKWLDTLKANTTYSFNFGESIVDNNEENILKNFKYVFSTGSVIDSLKIKGTVLDGFNKKQLKNVSVMLYEVNESYNDSILYKQTPRYLGAVSDSTATFTLENLRAGKYKLVALKEKTKNYKYNPKSDQIAFYSNTITLPTQEEYSLKLFKETPSFSAKKITQVSGNRFLLPFEGNSKNIKITANEKNTKTPLYWAKMADNDSIQLWIKPVKNDSIRFTVTNEGYTKGYKVFVKDIKKDSLHLSSKPGVVPLNNVFKLHSATPLIKWDHQRIILLDKKANKIAYKTAYDPATLSLQFDFEKKENQQYELQLLPNAIEDYLEQKNKDTLKFPLSTKALTDYGTLKLYFKNTKPQSLLVQLTDENEKIQYTKSVSSSLEASFDLIEPKKYNVRIIYDANNNLQWDSGNWLKKIQPEEIFHFNGLIDVRANWDINQEIILTH